MLALLIIWFGLQYGLGLGPATVPPNVPPGAPAEVVSQTPGRAPEPQIATGQFTTAVEIRPILAATTQSWIAIREYEGRDLLYFTHLLSWRCGLWEIRYGINDLAAPLVLPMEPCHEGTAAPNALTDQSGAFPIYVEAPLGSIEDVSIELFYDDGTSETAYFNRGFVLMP